MKKITCLLLLISLSNISFGQDIHWSQFNDNPIFQNPGNTGQFNGDIRFIGNYRDQWRSVTVPFSTISISVDSKLYNHKNLGFGGFQRGCDPLQPTKMRASRGQLRVPEAHN